MTSSEERYSRRGKLSSHPIQSPRSLFTEKILHIDLIYEAIFSYSSPQSVVRTRRTCRDAMTAVTFYISRAYSINKLLRRYFPDPLAFRSLQARTASLISGSIALQLFDRTIYPESDLDLYVYLRHGREIGHWLQAQGYRFEPAAEQNPMFEREYADVEKDAERYFAPHLLKILTFVKRANHGRGPLTQRRDSLRKVRLFVAKDTPMTLVLGAHSTCVMNVISYEKAYCLFPRATLLERVSIVGRQALGDSWGWPTPSTAFSKYAARGWRIIEKIPGSGGGSAPGTEASAPRPSSIPFGDRWIDDGQSWVIPLQLAGVENPSARGGSSALGYDPAALCNWVTKRGPRSSVEMHIRVLNTHALEYQYVLGDKMLVDDVRDVLHLLHSKASSHQETSGTSSGMRYQDTELRPLVRACHALIAWSLQVLAARKGGSQTQPGALQ